MLQDNKRIAKNTVFLYIRMLFVMGVSLFTSRVVLDKLGVVDYGLYNGVGGVVAMLMFLNGTLSTSTSRFLTFELGRNDASRLKSTFSTTFYTHLILALLIALFMESVGLWFVYEKLIIPQERLSAALWAYHISIFTTVIAITQVPYTSVIIAHENMKIYAYLGVFEAMAKLIIVYLLVISSTDRLIFYAVLVGAVQLIVAMFYRFYCIRHYEESHITYTFDKHILRKMLSFSGMSLLANASQVLSVQGLVVLMNMFFQPAIVAAQAIGNQLTNAMMQFISNLQTAINPQIIKLYAIGDYAASRKLTLQSSLYVHELMLLLCLPAIVVMNPLLHLWLVEVPPYAVVFAQYIILKQIFSVYNMTLYTPMVASGKLGSNSIAALLFGIGTFIILYILLKLGFDVMWVQYISVIQAILFSYVVKPYILCREIGYSWNEILLNFWKSLQVSVIPVITSIACSIYLTGTNLRQMMTNIIIVCSSVVVSSYLFLDKNTRSKLHDLIYKRIVH